LRGVRLIVHLSRHTDLPATQLVAVRCLVASSPRNAYERPHRGGLGVGPQSRVRG
jgi:hypothetical protein